MVKRVEFPFPLKTCPGREIWERYRKQKFLVFVDESFFMFFELASKTGYFCHAMVGVPVNEYPRLKEAVNPIFQEYKALTQASAQEFKHSEYKRIDFARRKDLAARLADAMKKHGAFIGGFYTSLTAFVLERVRFDIVDLADTVPENCEEQYRHAVETLGGGEKGPGNYVILSRLLELPVTAVASMLSEFDCTFRVIYDPREKREDKAIRAYVEAFANVLKHTLPDVSERYLGMDIETHSEDELGLQLADLVAGEIVDFFKANEELLAYGSTSRLITPVSEESIQTIASLGRRWVKTGVLTPMPIDLYERFFRDDPNGRTVLPCFVELMSSGILTCYGSFGTPRDLLIFEKLIWDQADFDLLSAALTKKVKSKRETDPERMIPG
jgi:hypothetical protein